VTMRLYDTARAEIVPFEPGPVVRTYVCGITPYDSTHLGHAFTYLTHDILNRRLVDLGHTVQMVRNVTDVDDSILPKARELGVNYLDLAASEMARFHTDLASLDVIPAFGEPRATESIDEIIALMLVLRDRGHTYTIDGTTWFDVGTSADFGELSRLDKPSMVALAAERGGTPGDERQNDPLDFVLWMSSAEDEPAWDSPFGPGRPGWHIECSAMASAAFDAPIDLHGGGNDLVFPHHECEIAQSAAAGVKPLATHWLHGGLVGYEGTKMSKSLGNLVFVRDLIAAGDARAIRLALLAHHYRYEFEWFDSEFDTAMDLLDTLVGIAGGVDPVPGELTQRVGLMLDDDLDTPGVHEALARAATDGPGAVAPADAAAACALIGIDLVRGGAAR